jgi:glycosyltransferase involved in cell wall biosynthesis
LVQHFVADGFVRTDAAAAVIGRTMFESDALPPAWAAGCNALDALWVPSQFNIESFRRAGVTVPMAVVPGGVDSAQYTPHGAARIVPGASGTVFLSVFEWRRRKGWDALLRAWAAAFTASDDVSLVLRTYVPGFSSSPEAIIWLEHTIDTFLRESCGRSRSEVAPIVLIPELVPESEMPALYRSAHAYVSPTRGEGWGRPLMEAMASGLPVIATRWSGHLEYMNDDNSLLIDVDGLVSATDPDALVYRDTQWAEPNVDHLVAHLRAVHHDRAHARAIGERARHDMAANWTWERAAEVIVTQARALSDTFRTTVSARTPTLANDTHARLLLDANAFSASTTPIALTALIAPLHRLSASRVGTLHVLTQPDSERPALASALHAAWRDRIDASGVDMRANDVCLTWCGVDDSEPTNVHPRGIRVVCTGDAVLDAVPESLARSLRDHATDIWVPHAAAEAAVMALGISAERVLRIPDMRLLGAALVDALNSTGGVTLAPRRRVFLAVSTPKDVAAAELTVRLWPRVSGSAAELAIRIDRESADTVREWGASLARRTRETRGLEHVSVWEERFALASIPSLLRRADVLLVPDVTVVTPTWLALARELGCAVIAPEHPLLVDWPQDTVWRVGVGTGVTLSGAQLAPALSALCTTDALHVRRAAMRAFAAAFPTPDAIAALLVARVVALVQAREARA